jgi:hypothetical protein
MSDHKAICRPEELVDDRVRRDDEWLAWEREVVQIIVDQLYPLLVSNYPGSGWFCVHFACVEFTNSASPWYATRSAFGPSMKRLFAAVNAVYNPAGWQMSGQHDSYSIDFNFRPLEESVGFLERFGSVSAGASIDCRAPVLPAQPSHVRPNLRGPKSEVSGVVLRTRESGRSSPEQFIYEHLC